MLYLLEGDNLILYDDGKMNFNEFFSQLIAEFANLTETIKESLELGEFYTMDRFAHYTIEQYRNNNFTELSKYFQFIEDRLDIVKIEIIYALKVSYCETIICEVNDLAIQKYMGSKFKEFYLEYEEFWNKLNSSY